MKKLVHGARFGWIREWVVLLLLVGATFFVYRECLRAPFVYDDISKITENPDIRSLRELPKKLIYPYHEPNWERNDPSRPVTYLTFALNYHFGELNPFGYHLVNVLLHILNFFLLVLFIRKIYFFALNKNSWFFPLAVSAFFAIHPIHSIVVSYVFNRSGQLSAFFFLSAILLFIRAREGKSFFLPLSVLSYVFALFSKQDAITLPAILLIFDFVFLSQKKIQKVLMNRAFHLPFWGVFLGYILFRYFYFGELGDVEAGTSPQDWPPLLYLAVQPFILMRYLFLMLWPQGLSLDHVMNKPTTFLQVKFIGSYLFLGSVLWMAWKAYQRSTGESKLLLFSILWFLINLSPTSSFFPTTAVMAENRLYLAGIGFYLILVLVYFSFFHVDVSNQAKGSLGRPARWVLGGLMAIHLIFLSLVTMERCKLFQSPTLLWEDVFAQYPTSLRAINNTASQHNNLGRTLGDAGEREKAIKEFKRALEIKPESAEAQFNLALIYFQNSQERHKSLEEFLRVVALKPKHADAHNNIGIFYLEQKKYEKARHHFEKAVEADPNLPKAHNNLAFLFYTLKQYQAALKEFNIGLQLDPTNDSVRTQIQLIQRKCPHCHL